MHIVRLSAMLAGLALSVPRLAAQQPSPHPMPQRHSGMMMDSSAMAQHARMNDSLDARLDTLVGRMNRATGDRKTAAMADVLNELVVQRKAMRTMMHRMMGSPGGMMPRMKGGRPPADSAGHAEHHPPS